MKFCLPLMLLQWLMGEPKIIIVILDSIVEQNGYK